METNNIQIRALRWMTMIQIETDKVNQVLQLNSHPITKYKFEIKNPLLHLAFLTEWKGLKMAQIKSIPKSYIEFEQKVM